MAGIGPLTGKPAAQNASACGQCMAATTNVAARLDCYDCVREPGLNGTQVWGCARCAELTNINNRGTCMASSGCPIVPAALPCHAAAPTMLRLHLNLLYTFGLCCTDLCEGRLQPGPVRGYC